MSISNIKSEGSRDICQAFGDKQVKQRNSEDLCEGPDEFIDCVPVN